MLRIRTLALPALAVALPGFLPLAPAESQPVFPATDVSSRPSIVRSADIPYAVVNGQELMLDLYLPANVESPPLLVYVHGGAWRFGARDSVSPIDLVEHGYAIASVSFRLTPVAPLPAQEIGRAHV